MSDSIKKSSTGCSYRSRYKQTVNSRETSSLEQMASHRPSGTTFSTHLPSKTPWIPTLRISSPLSSQVTMRLIILMTTSCQSLATQRVDRNLQLALPTKLTNRGKICRLRTTRTNQRLIQSHLSSLQRVDVAIVARLETRSLRKRHRLTLSIQEMQLQGLQTSDS